MRIWVQKSASMEKRTSPLKFGHLAEKSGFNSVPNLSTARKPGRTTTWPSCTRRAWAPCSRTRPRPSSSTKRPARRGTWRPRTTSASCTSGAMVGSWVAMNFLHHLTNFRRSVLDCMDSYDSEIATQVAQINIFRDLQDLHSFAPLRFQKFTYKVSNIFPNWIFNFNRL